MKLNKQFKEGMACNSVKKPHSAFARAVCFSVHPGKMILFPFKHWFNKRYKGRYKFQRLVFSIDLFLLGIIVALGTVAAFFLVNPPLNFADKIHFESTVAPREVVAGAPSTLIIRFTNNTEEELRNVNLSFEYPNHFLLQEISATDATIKDNLVLIDSVPVGSSGTARIRGVMFGDVQGEQTFTSTMNFIHGLENDVAGQKVSSHVFSPVRSTLSLSLDLPERLVSYQPIKGTITYENTGEIDFPVISIEPEWPTGFKLNKSNTQIVRGAFEVPAVAASEKGVMEFEGVLGDSGEEVTFTFNPSFTFGETRYKQDTLIHSAPIMPPQIEVSHSADKKTLQPGSTASFVVSYENVGDFELTDVSIGVGSYSPFFLKDNYTVSSKQYPELKKLMPGDSGQIEISVPLRSSISQSETNVYENIELVTNAVSFYNLPDDETRIGSRGNDLTSTLTTPLVLESFGRYTTQSGDQIGRGPLPPRVDKETKYWIFWHIDGTTNKIKDVEIDGVLPANVEFTGKQTTSQNKGVKFDAKTRTVSWKANSVSPTLSPKAKIVGVAFEVALIPTPEQVGLEPYLIQNVQITAIDAKTGAFLSYRGKSVNTAFFSDKMASGKSIVK
jgi:hypothetical protein